MTFSNASWRAAIAGRWTARIAGTLMTLFFLAFLVGEGPPPLWRLGWQQNLQFLGMCGLCAGLVTAWKWEGWGGLATLAAYGVLLLVDRRFNGTWLFRAPAMVGLVHVLCWWRITAGAPVGGGWEIPKRLLQVAAAAVGVFILLCANEIFGNPPLMTPALHPSAGLTGEWRSHGTAGVPVQFRIGDDGGVAGRIGEDAVVGGSIVNNRSWFGKTMHWREPLLIRGDGFMAPVSLQGGKLSGCVTRGGQTFNLELEKQ